MGKSQDTPPAPDEIASNLKRIQGRTGGSNGSKESVAQGVAQSAEKEEQHGEVLGLRQADQGQGLLLESSADVQEMLPVFHRKGASGETETQEPSRQDFRALSELLNMTETQIF